MYGIILSKRISRPLSGLADAPDTLGWQWCRKDELLLDFVLYIPVVNVIITWGTMGILNHLFCEWLSHRKWNIPIGISLWNHQVKKTLSHFCTPTSMQSPQTKQGEDNKWMLKGRGGGGGMACCRERLIVQRGLRNNRMGKCVMRLALLVLSHFRGALLLTMPSHCSPKTHMQYIISDVFSWCGSVLTFLK